MSRRGRTRRKLKKQRKIIVVSLIAFLFIMVGGYAAFQTNLNITAKGNINPRNNLYVSNLGSDETGRGTQARPYKTLAKAYNSAAEEATIYVMDNLTIDETVIFDQNKKITLTSETNEINSLLRGEEDEMLLKISSGETTFTNITIDGQNKESNGPLLDIDNNSVINVIDNTIIQNNINISESGGGLIVEKSTINIDGVKIINNHCPNDGGGGLVAKNASITITDGLIFNNSSTNGGGILFAGDEGQLVMNGGIISDNQATIYDGGGIRLLSAEFIMNNGEISNNYSKTVGGGIFISTWNVLPNVGSVFNYKNGKIINNKAETNGGGIYVNTISTYTNEGGKVFDNTPDDVYKANS